MQPLPTLVAFIKPSSMAFTLLLAHAAALPLATPANADAQEPYSPNVGTTPDRQVYFGDTHVHTGLSADAGGSGD